MFKWMMYLFILFAVFALDHSAVRVSEIQTKNQIESFEEIARRGCCSWHGGVCGCNNQGRVICCDGRLSPSCTCLRPSSQEFEMSENNTEDSLYSLAIECW